MSGMILSVSEPFTYQADDKPVAIVAVGGGVYGQNGGKLCLADIDLRCNQCHQIYPLAEQPLALAFVPSGAVVVPGYVEMCPHCLQDTPAGDVIEVVF